MYGRRGGSWKIIFEYFVVVSIRVLSGDFFVEVRKTCK